MGAAPFGASISSAVAEGGGILFEFVSTTLIGDSLYVYAEAGMKLGVTVLCSDEAGKDGAEDLGTTTPPPPAPVAGVSVKALDEEVGVFTR